MRLRFVIIWASFLCASYSLLVAQQAETHAVDPAELVSIIERTDKVVVYDSSPSIYADGAKAPPRILYSSVNPKDIGVLQKSVAVERPESWFRCACLPYIDMVLSRKGKELGVISVSEDLTIGFSRWDGDARLADTNKLVRWFSDRGVSDPRHKLEDMHALERRDQRNEERWLKAMPPNLRPLWPGAMQDPEWWSLPTHAVANSANTLKAELAREFPDVKVRIRALFAWFGSGAGPWSGYPAYEDVPSSMLLEYEDSELIGALEGAPMSESQYEGVARFFSGYCYGHDHCPPEESTLLPLLPEKTKQLLLTHFLKSSDSDKVERARHAFGQKGKPAS